MIHAQNEVVDIVEDLENKRDEESDKKDINKQLYQKGFVGVKTPRNKIQDEAEEEGENEGKYAGAGIGIKKQRGRRSAEKNFEKCVKVDFFGVEKIDDETETDDLQVKRRHVHIGKQSPVARGRGGKQRSADDQKDDKGDFTAADQKPENVRGIMTGAYDIENRVDKQDHDGFREEIGLIQQAGNQNGASEAQKQDERQRPETNGFQFTGEQGKEHNPHAETTDREANQIAISDNLAEMNEALQKEYE